MAVNDILLDTNAYVAFKQGQPDALEVVQRATHLALSSTVLGELLAGFAVGSREAKNRAELQQFLSSDRVHILMVDDGTAAYYATVYRLLRNKGRPTQPTICGSLHQPSSTAMPSSAMIATSSMWMDYWLVRRRQTCCCHNIVGVPIKPTEAVPPNSPFQPTAPVGAFFTLAILKDAFPIYECDPRRGGG